MKKAILCLSTLFLLACSDKTRISNNLTIEQGYKSAIMANQCSNVNLNTIVAARVSKIKDFRTPDMATYHNSLFSLDELCKLNGLGLKELVKQLEIKANFFQAAVYDEDGVFTFLPTHLKAFNISNSYNFIMKSENSIKHFHNEEVVSIGKDKYKFSVLNDFEDSVLRQKIQIENITKNNKEILDFNKDFFVVINGNIIFW